MCFPCLWQRSALNVYRVPCRRLVVLRLPSSSSCSYSARATASSSTSLSLSRTSRFARRTSSGSASATTRPWPPHPPPISLALLLPLHLAMLSGRALRRRRSRPLSASRSSTIPSHDLYTTAPRRHLRRNLAPRLRHNMSIVYFYHLSCRLSCVGQLSRLLLRTSQSYLVVSDVP